MVERTKLFIAFVVMIIMATCVNAQDQSKIIDLSETIFKSNCLDIADFGTTGFGIHDTGQRKYKILNWNCQLVKEFPIRRGEGPGELRQDVTAACIIKNGEFLLHGGPGYIINRYNGDGKYINSFKTKFYPKKMLYRNGKLYVFSAQILFSKPDASYGAVFDPISGEHLNDLKLKGIIDKNAPDHVTFINGIHFAFDSDGALNILLGATGSIYRLDENGKLLKKITLPYKSEKEVIKKKNGTTVSWKKFYTGMTFIEDSVYIVLMELSYDKNKPDKSRLIKIEKNGKVSEKVFYDRYMLIGHSNDKLILFQDMEYFALPVPITDLNKPN